MNYDKLTKSFKTILEMLCDRKLIVKYNDSIYDLIKSNGEKNGFVLILDDIRIVYYMSHKFKFSELKEYYKNINKTYKINILVVNDKISINNLKMIYGIDNSIEIFNIKELQFNLTHHELVPKHELVTSIEEINILIKNYSLKSRNQLPHILRTDPMAKYLGLKQGDVVRITRISETSGIYVTYRYCS